MPEAPFRVLVVCTANMCRSPLTEHLIARWVGDSGRQATIEVESAGTDAFAGAPMCREACDVVGLDPHWRAARELTAEQLTRADLVLALDRSHRSACARLVPACRPRLFTLRRAADLATRVMATVADGSLPDGAPPMPADPAGRLRWLVAELDAGRGLLAGQPEGSEDIEDLHGPAPHPEVFAEVAETTDRLTKALAACLALPG